MQQRTTDTTLISEEEDVSSTDGPTIGGPGTTAGFGVGQGEDADAGSGGSLHETGVGWDGEADSVEHEAARG